jgi:hypothetical protein
MVQQVGMDELLGFCSILAAFGRISSTSGLGGLQGVRTY